MAWVLNQPAAPWVIDSGRAWLAAAGVAVANGIAFGTAYTFGTFFRSMADEFDAGSGATAVIFGITLLLFFGFGIVSGPLSDRFGPLPLLAAGGALFVVGLVLTSFVNNLWLGCVTFGLGVGLGGGCFVAPLTAAAGSLFTKYRAAALGVVATGNGLGTLLLIPFAESMISGRGWRFAYRGLAIVALVGFLFALVAVLRAPTRPAGTPGGVDSFRSVLADPGFSRLFWSGVFMGLGLFTAFAFIQSFATDNGVSDQTAARIFGAIGLSSIVGRLGLTNLSNRLGPVRLYQVMLALQPIAYLIWFFADGSVLWLTIFALVLGTTYGGFVAITPEVVFHLSTGGAIGRLMGVLFLAFGIGGFIAPPVAGWLADNSGQRPVIIGVIAVVTIAVLISSGMRGAAPVTRDLAT